MKNAPIQYGRGFTLIEVMLAVGIMAIILLVINGVFFSAMRLRNRTSEAITDALPAHQALIFLRRDLQGAMPPGGVLAGDFKVGNVSEVNMSQPVDVEMYTSTGALLANVPWADIQMVTYELAPPVTPGPAGGNDLIRSVTRNLLCTTIPDVENQWLMSGVKDIQFSCYDGVQWLDTWDTTNGNTNLPVAVRVRIQLAGSSASDPIELLVPVLSQSPTNLIQIASNPGN